jgi:hypothetical protein
MENIILSSETQMIYLCNGSKEQDYKEVINRLHSISGITENHTSNLQTVENLDRLDRGQILETIAPPSPVRGEENTLIQRLIVTNSVFTTTEYNSKQQLVNILTGVGSNRISGLNYLNLNYYLSEALEYVFNNASRLGSTISSFQILSILSALQTNNIMELNNRDGKIYRLKNIQMCDMSFELVREEVVFAN